MGPGVIAEKFAGACKSCEGVTLLGAASRSREKAEAFVRRHGLEKVYDSYEALLADPSIDAVYISVIHNRAFFTGPEMHRSGKGRSV